MGQRIRIANAAMLPMIILRVKRWASATFLAVAPTCPVAPGRPADGVPSTRSTRPCVARRRPYRTGGCTDVRPARNGRPSHQRPTGSLPPMTDEWETVIGLEVHAELLT